MADENLHVDISGDEPEIVVEHIGEPGGAAVLSDSPQDGIEDLKRQLAEANHRAETAHALAESERRRADEEGRRAAEASRAAAENSVAASTAAADAREREYESILNAHTAVSNSLVALKDQLTTAQTNGDFAAASDLQVKISQAAAKLERLDDGKQAIEAARNASQPQPTRRAAPAETQEQFNGRAWSNQEYENVMRGCTSTTAAWMRANPRYGTDPNFRRQIQGAHNLVTGQGIQPDTDQYFRRVEELVGIRQEQPALQPQTEGGPAVSAAAKPVQTRTSPQVAAPPSRSVPSPQNPAGGNQNTVQLTPAMREMAKIMFPKTKPTDLDPDVAYARHLAALRREGRLKDGGITL